MAGHAEQLNDNNFQKVIGQGVTLVDFYADWCGPCKMVAPIVERLASSYQGKATIGKLNIDSSQETTVQYDVTSIPTLILFKDGKEVKRVVGLRDEASLKSMIDSAL